jgi:hypothetical protein
MAVALQVESSSSGVASGKTRLLGSHASVFSRQFSMCVVSLQVSSSPFKMLGSNTKMFSGQSFPNSNDKAELSLVTTTGSKVGSGLLDVISVPGEMAVSEFRMSFRMATVDARKSTGVRNRFGVTVICTQVADSSFLVIGGTFVVCGSLSVVVGSFSRICRGSSGVRSGST